MPDHHRRLLLLALALCSGCSAPPATTAGGVARRWFDNEPQRVFSPAQVYDLKPAFEWSFVEPPERGRWRPTDVERLEPGEHGLRVVPATLNPRLVRRVEIKAEDVHAIDVAVSGLCDGRIAVFWAGPLQRFASERQIEVKPRPCGRGPAKVETYRFEVASHRKWRGKISRLRLDPTDQAGEITELVSVTGLYRVVDGDRLSAALESAWKVNLGDDVRNAVLAPPGTQHTWRVAIPAAGVLHLEYGLESLVQGEVRFLAWADRGGGDRTPLLDRTLRPGRGENGRWFETTLDLSGLGTSELTLRLETSATADYDLQHGFPVWANPEIIDPDLMADRPNVVLICLDTLRADRLSCYGHDRPTSPNIDRWARRSATLFRHVVAPAPWTLPSHVSLFTGLDAVRHGVNHSERAPGGLDMLAEILRREGYATGAVTAGGNLHPDFGFAQGFDSFSFWRGKYTEAELRTGLDRTLDWLDRHRERPFFLFFHTYETHYPHWRVQPFFDRLTGSQARQLRGVEFMMRAHPRRELRYPGDYFEVSRPGQQGVSTVLGPDEVDLLGAMYDSSVAYADSQVQRLLERLQELGPERPSLIILTSDHGEALGEDQRAGHSYLEDYNLLVPLIIELPEGRGTGAEVTEQVRLIDVLPTVLEVAGIARRSAVDGVSLLPLIEGRATVHPQEAWSYAPSSNRGLALRLANRLKYVYNDAAWDSIAGEDRLYDLIADPDERNDLARGNPLAEELRARARGVIEEQYEGVRVLIRNSSPYRLEGELSGPWVAANRVKSIEPGCRCVRWSPGGKAAFSLPPGRETTMLLHAPGSSAGQVSGALIDEAGRSRHPFAASLDLGQLETPRTLLFTGSDWEHVPGAKVEIATGFKLWRSPGRAPAAQAQTPLDPELERQLRALGYLD